MKNAIILLSVLFMMTGCGGDSGDKASSATPTASSGTNFRENSTVGGGSTDAAATLGFTPYSRGESTVTRSELFLEFDVDSSGQVSAYGDYDKGLQSGFGDCTLPVGSYDITTTSKGREGIRVHNYNDIVISASGPVTFTALIENSLSLQNQNGEWVMFAVLKVQSVEGSACSSTLSFSMPLAQ